MRNLFTLAVLFAMCFNAEASLKIRLTEGGADGVVGTGGDDRTVVITDEVFVTTLPAAPVPAGSYVSSDAMGGVNGTVVFNGSLGAFNIVVTTGASKPIIGPARLDLNNISISSSSAGQLKIELTDTDFDLSTPVNGGIKWEVGGVAGGTLEAKIGADNDNAEFDFSSASNSYGPFSGAFSTVEGIGFLPDGSFSLSQEILIKHTAAGQASSFNSLVTVVPEPGTILIWSMLSATALCLFFGCRRKTK